MRCWTWSLGAALLAALAIGPVSAADAPAATKAPEAKKADEATKAESPAAPKAEAAQPEAAPPAAAPPAAAAPGRPTGDNDLAVMIRECKLSEEQVTKLAQAASAIMAQLADWQKTNADKLAVFQKDFEAARKSNDEAALAKVRTESQPIFQERMNLVLKGQKGMMEILTPEQRSTWMGFITFRQLMVAMVPVDLKAEQLTKIREICNAAGKDLDAIKEEGEAGMAALIKVRTAILANVRDNVLTAAQRAQLPAQLTENPPVPPAAGATTPAADPKAPAKDSKAPETKAPESKAPAAEKKAPEKK